MAGRDRGEEGWTAAPFSSQRTCEETKTVCYKLHNTSVTLYQTSKTEEETHLKEHFANVLALSHESERLLHLVLLIHRGSQRLNDSFHDALLEQLGHFLPLLVALFEESIQQDSVECHIL